MIAKASLRWSGCSGAGHHGWMDVGRADIHPVVLQARTVDLHLAIQGDCPRQGDAVGVAGNAAVRHQDRTGADLNRHRAAGQGDAVALGLPVVDQRAAIIEAPDLDVLAVIRLGTGIAI